VFFPKTEAMAAATQLDLLEWMEKPTLEAVVKPDIVFDSEDWAFVTRHPENTRFERKSARIDPKDLAVCLSAFGNGPAIEGGVVAIGIEKDGSIAGCKDVSPTKLQELEYMGRDHCTGGRFSTKRLGVVNKLGEPDFIILARVYYVEERLVELTNGAAYCRESDRSRRLLDSEKDEIRINKGERAFELEPCALVYPDDFRMPLIRRFANQVLAARGSSAAILDEEVLESMRLGKIREGKFVPSNICALMFAKDPQQVFPGAYIHFLRFEGTEERSGSEYNVSKDRMFTGTILEVIGDTSQTLDATLREFTEFNSGKFHQVPEYPRDAWYELIVNACVHRSYHAKTQPIFVKMFDDHFEVESPGGFMPSVTPENLFHKPRNPFLMFVLREFGEVRCISEGTKRIKREMTEAKLPPAEFLETGHSIRATLRNDIANRTNSLDSEAYQILGQALAFSLDADERRLVNFVVEQGKINASDALRILSTTYWHTAKRKLKRLADRGILTWVSTKARDPNSHFILTKR
jgi:ATP-dependent DNA helicase RecG